MSKELSIKLGDFDKMDRTCQVLQNHMDVLERRQASLRMISLAISEALEELWWTAGTSAKQKIRRVEELAQGIRNEDSITVEPTFAVEPVVSIKPGQKGHRRIR